MTTQTHNALQRISLTRLAFHTLLFLFGAALPFLYTVAVLVIYFDGCDNMLSHAAWFAVGCGGFVLCAIAVCTVPCRWAARLKFMLLAIVLLALNTGPIFIAICIAGIMAWGGYNPY